MQYLLNTDPELYRLINLETQRQNETLDLIPSENMASPAVLEALGSALTNKYAEGYPGKRYYGGCEIVDQIETLAIERAKLLFGAEHANVQAHAGSQANAAVYFALLKPGDTVMAMDLAHGGHLTHGSPVNFSGQLYKFVPYGVRKDNERIDLDELAAQARLTRPKLIVAGWTSYPRHLDFEAFRKIADEASAYLMVDMSHFAGLVAAKVHPDPIPWADVVATTTHKTLRGPRSAIILSKLLDRFDHTKTLAQKIDKAIFPGLQGGPLVHAIAAKAVAFHEAAQSEFKTYQRQVLKNAQVLAETLAQSGVRLISGGTDTHLVLADMTSVGTTGKIAETVLNNAGIIANKNMIPFDLRKPLDPSGLRLGTPTVTSRGFGEAETRQLAQLIVTLLKNIASSTVLDEVKIKVKELAAAHPLPYGSNS